MIRTIKLMGMGLICIFVSFIGYIFWLQHQEYRSMERNLLLFEEEMSDWQLVRQSTYYYPFYPISDIVSYVYAEYSIPVDLQLTESIVEETFDNNWQDATLFNAEQYSLFCYDDTLGASITIKESILTLRIDGIPKEGSQMLPMVVYKIPDHCFP